MLRSSLAAVAAACLARLLLRRARRWPGALPQPPRPVLASAALPPRHAARPEPPHAGRTREPHGPQRPLAPARGERHAARRRPPSPSRRRPA